MATRRAHRPHNFRALSKPKPIKKHEHRHYLPYIPVLLLVMATFFVSFLQPLQRHGVLAYATNMSSGGLQSSTNQQRAAGGLGTLAINAALSSAAQAKANDMVSRNYWSHNTPDGQEPWVFMDGAGYKYQKAGENLAYGFTNSDDTVAGWMNSASHKANMLDGDFTEVGFGFANSENFNNNGQQTVIVAMYGKPQVLAANNPAPAAPQPAPVAPTASQPATAAPAPEAPPTAPAEEKTPTPAPVNTDKPVAQESPSQPVARVQTLTGGGAPWALFAAGILTGSALVVLLLKHAAGLRHLLRDGERFILHHPLLDFVLVSLVLVGTFLSQTSGFIK